MQPQEYEILIIEDNPHDAELMVRALRRHHLANNIIVLDDGEQALDFIFCRGQYADRDPFRSPKVIFLDLKLPKVSGLEVLKEVKSNAATKKIPVIVVTSSTEDPDIETSYDIGANSYVVKPVDFDDFVEKINQLGLYWMVVNENRK